MSSDTIISIDLETTGLVPGVHSILSLGAVSYIDRKEHSSFYQKIDEALFYRDPAAMKFWEKHPDQYLEARKDPKDPFIVMGDFSKWVEKQPKPRILAANPAAADAGFLWYYLHTFCESGTIEKLFGRQRVLDIRSILSVVLNKDYSKSDRDAIPDSWSDGFKINHVAIDDAREQGAVLMHALKEMDLIHISNNFNNQSIDFLAHLC